MNDRGKVINEALLRFNKDNLKVYEDYFMLISDFIHYNETTNDDIKEINRKAVNTLLYIESQNKIYANEEANTVSWC